MADGIKLTFDTDSMIRGLDMWVNALNNRDLVRKATYETAQQALGFVEDSLRKASAGAYQSIMSGTSKSKKKNFATRHRGIDVWQGSQGLSSIVSISQAHADYRLHWLEGGTGERYTAKIRKDRVGRYQYDKGKKNYDLSVKPGFRGKMDGYGFMSEVADRKLGFLTDVLEKKLLKIFDD